MGKGIFVNNIEAPELINLIAMISIFVLVIASFREIKNVSDAIAGFVAYFVGSERENIGETRIKKLEKTFRSLAYVILISLFFMLFQHLFNQIHPALAGVILIIIVIWAIVSLISVAMVLSTEIEEAAHKFSNNLEKQIKKKKK